MLIRNAVLIIGAFLMFTFPHTILAGATAKAWVAARVGSRVAAGWYRIMYNLLAVLTLAPPFLLAILLSDQTLYRVPFPFSLALIAIQLIGVLGVIVSLLSTRVLHFAGLTQIANFITAQESQDVPMPLRVSGVYRLVRHPLYFFALLALWALPVMTFNTLIFNVAATLYFTLGSLIEERRLERLYGEAYREYRKQVPWMIPYRWPRLRP